MPKPTCVAVPPNVKNITGQTFGRWLVLGYTGSNKHRASMWLCRCSCPDKTEKIICIVALKNGKSKSCGCLYRETRQSSAMTHGGCYDPEYVSYTCMMKRCYDPTHKSYPRYGGAGVTVQASWHNNYPQFKKDMPKMPSLKHDTVDRIDGTGNYELGNVRWATRKEQQRNIKSNVFLTLGDVTLCQAAWTEKMGWHPSKIKNRRRMGWTDEEILSTP